MKRAFDYQRDKSFKITVNTDRSNKSDSKMSDIDRRMAENDRKMREIAEKWVDFFESIFFKFSLIFLGKLN